MLCTPRTTAHLLVFSLVAAALGACGGGVSRSRSTAASGAPIQPLAASQAPTAAVTPTEAIVAPQSFPSLAALATAYGAPLFVPTPPPGWTLSTMQLWRTQAPAGAAPRTNVVTLRYTDTAGHYLEAMQGTPVPVGGGAAYQVAPADMKGTTEVLGQPAIWVRGVAVGAPHQPPVWHQGPLSLAWTPRDWPPSGAASGYRLESDVLDLPDLVAIAATLHD